MLVREWDGKQITEPGIYSGIGMQSEYEDGPPLPDGSPGPRVRTRLGYHDFEICDGPSLSSGILRATEQTSMDEVWLKFPGNPDRVEEGDKVHFNKGRARHTLFLGEEGFLRDYVFQPATYPVGATYPSREGVADKDGVEEKKWTGAAKWCKAWSADQKKLKKSVLPPDEMDDIKGAAARLSQHPEIRDGGILNGLVEHSIFWKDPITGLWLKARPDNIPTSSAMIVDYKGARDVSYRAIEKALDESGYHQQLALIGEGMREVAGIEITDYVLVFQKWVAPWSVNVKPVAGEAIQYGAMQNRRAINRIAEALKTGIWPGPDDDGVPVNLPKYARDRLDAQHKAGLLPEPTEPS